MNSKYADVDFLMSRPIPPDVSVRPGLLEGLKRSRRNGENMIMTLKQREQADRGVTPAGYYRDKDGALRAVIYR